MMRRQVFYKRKVKGALSHVFFSGLLFLGVFLLCFGIWYILHKQHLVESPLAKIVTGENLFLTKIQSLCLQNHIHCAKITLNQDKTAIIEIDGEEQVILALQKDLSQQFSSLQLTIGHLTIEGKRFHRLDFRFDKPVITF